MKLLLLAAALAVASAGPVPDNAKIDHPDCGQRSLYNEAIDTKIVGGSEAQPNSWPWMCSLRRNGGHICGGSLIRNAAGNFFFITAAHCVSQNDFNAGRYQVRCGIHYRLGSGESNEQVLSLNSLIRHPQYSSSNYRNDVAIMTLNSNPTQTGAVSAVCIAVNSYETGGGGNTRGNCYVTGWGTLSSGGSSPNALHQVEKPIVSDSFCASAYGTAFHAPTMMCAGVPNEGGKDACQGDSGGPLVVNTGGEWQLYGVVSWGYGCAHPDYPGVYADVYQLKSWISSVIN